MVWVAFEAIMLDPTSATMCVIISHRTSGKCNPRFFYSCAYTNYIRRVAGLSCFHWPHNNDVSRWRFPNVLMHLFLLWAVEPPDSCCHQSHCGGPLGEARLPGYGWQQTVTQLPIRMLKIYTNSKKRKLSPAKRIGLSPHRKIKKLRLWTTTVVVLRKYTRVDSRLLIAWQQQEQDTQNTGRTSKKGQHQCYSLPRSWPYSLPDSYPVHYRHLARRDWRDRLSRLSLSSPSDHAYLPIHRLVGSQADRPLPQWACDGKPRRCIKMKEKDSDRGQRDTIKLPKATDKRDSSRTPWSRHLSYASTKPYSSVQRSVLDVLEIVRESENNADRHAHESTTPTWLKSP